MRRSSIALLVALTFVLGATVGVVVAKKTTVAPGTYVGQSPDEAAEALLDIATGQAGDGSWQNIHLARVYYLSGREEQARAILDRVLNSPKVTAGDWGRAARLYEQAGDWDKAQVAFERAIEMKPNEEDWLAEFGAYHNLHGDRERAEELFRRSFAIGGSLNNTLNVAGSYVGVTPRKR